jgi:hypothetical protein
MNIVVPDILAGGMGRAMQQTGQTIASSITAVGGTAQKVVDSVSAQVAAYEKEQTIKQQQGFVEATQLGINMSEQQDAVYNGAVNNMKLVDRTEMRDIMDRINSIGQDTAGQSQDRDVRGYLERVNDLAQQSYSQRLEEAYSKSLFGQSVDATKKRAQDITEDAVNRHDLPAAMSGIAGLLKSQERYYGSVFANELLQDELFKSIQRYADANVQDFRDPAFTKETLSFFHPSRQAQVQGYINNALNDFRREEALSDVLEYAGELGKAAQFWSRPETATRFGLTAENWRRGGDELESLLNLRDARDRRTIDGAGQKLTALYAGVDTGTIPNADRGMIEQALSRIEDTDLQKALVDHWEGIFSELKTAKQKQRDGERVSDPLSQGDSAIEAEYIMQSMKDPAKVNMTEVNILLGKGISLDAYNTIRENVGEGAKGVWKTETGKYSQYLLEHYLSGGKFDPDEKENAAMFVNLQGYMKHYVRQKPGAEPAELQKIINDYLQPHQDAVVAGWLDEVRRRVNGSSRPDGMPA